MFEFNGWDFDLGLEVNWYDFSDNSEQNFQTLSYFGITQIDIRPGWKWIPTALETTLKVGEAWFRQDMVSQLEALQPITFYCINGCYIFSI